MRLRFPALASPLALAAVAVLAALIMVALPSLALAAAPGAGGQALRHRCTLLDGSVHLMVDDLSKRHPGMVQQCVAVTVAAEPIAPFVVAQGGFTDVGGYRGGMRVTLIEAPSPGPWLPGSTLAAPRIPADLAPLVREASARHRLDAGLMSALIHVESRFRRDAVSPKGAMGLMQVMPSTAAQYGVTSARALLDPRTNLDVGGRHLRMLHDRYGDRVDLILAAYNAGEGAVKRYGNRVPPYKETQGYVKQITELVGVPAPRE